VSGQLVLLIAGLAVGMFSGALLTAIYTHAQVSRAQERMQRIVLHWQAEVRAQRAASMESDLRLWTDLANLPMDRWGG
jgi:hypothetical protein